jgi:hypothetical protein
MLPITKMMYNQSILTITQYEDQSPGDKRHNIFVHPVFTCAPTSYVTLCNKSPTSATICPQPMQYTLGSLNLTFDLQSSKRDVWEGEALAQRMHKSVRNVKRPPQGPVNKYL